MDAPSRLIAKRYALAYIQANEDIEKAMDCFFKIYDAIIAYLPYFKHPCIPSGVKINILSKMLEDNLKGGKAEFFIKILIESKRINLLPLIRSEIEKLYNEKKGIERVKIYSRFELSDKELGYIGQAISHLTKGKLVFDKKTKQNIIGGFQAQVGDFFLDASISGRLEDLKKRLLN